LPQHYCRQGIIAGLALAVKYYVILIALALAACAQPGYMYDTGSFVQHPRPEFCSSHGQVLDPTTLQCVTPPPPPPPTQAQIEQSQKGDATRRERDACVNVAGRKFQLKAEGAVASYEIWRAELKQCDDLWVSRRIAQQMMSGDCSLKLDWMLRYRMLVYVAEQKEMAEDRYAEICGKARRN
jgi:hypothetical protein